MYPASPWPKQLRVVESEWSRRWGCEAVGSCGVVVCTDSVRGKKYRVLAQIKQSVLAAQPPQDGGRYGNNFKCVCLTYLFVIAACMCDSFSFMLE